jgi:hypothetical protein
MEQLYSIKRESMKSDMSEFLKKLDYESNDIVSLKPYIIEKGAEWGMLYIGYTKFSCLHIFNWEWADEQIYLSCSINPEKLEDVKVHWMWY